MSRIRAWSFSILLAISRLIAAGTITEDLYINVVTADTSECLDKVTRLPIREYEFRFDSVAGRRQLGVIGADLAKVLPESVEIKSATFPNPTKGEAPILVENVAYIDKNVLFMQNVGATQELMRRQDALAERISALLSSGRRLDELAGAVGLRMEEEAGAQVLERRRIAEAEAERQRLQAELDQARREEERRAAAAAADDERRRAEREHDARGRRLDAEAAAEAGRTARRLQLEEESAARTERLRRETDEELRAVAAAQEREAEGERAAAELRRVAAEAAARAAAERENEELELRRIRAQGEEDRRRLLEAVGAVGTHLGDAALSLLQSPLRAAGLCLWLVALALGYFTVRETASLARAMVEASLGRPSLVRETSKGGVGVRAAAAVVVQAVLAALWAALRAVRALLASVLGCRRQQQRQKGVGSASGVATPAGNVTSAAPATAAACTAATNRARSKNKASPFAKRAPADGGDGGATDGATNTTSSSSNNNGSDASDGGGGGGGGGGSSSRDVVSAGMADVVLEPTLREQVLSLATATRSARRNSAPYRHLLLYGPPGTGKTMVAKRLAAVSGMDWAVMSGGDVGPLGRAAVTELHKLFQWARRSRRGLLLFVDEAEAFLGSRGARGMSEETRNALNALLYQTGTATSHFMLVLATNRAEDLDEAVLDRMDDSLLFPLPNRAGRARLLAQYFRLYVAPAATAAAAVAAGGGGGLRGWIRRLAGKGEASSGSSNSKPGARNYHGNPTAAEPEGVAVGAEAPPAFVDEAAVAAVAPRLEGFSGREIAKLMLSLQNAVYGSEDLALTRALLEAVVAQKVAEHERKAVMLTEGDGDSTIGGV